MYVTATDITSTWKLKAQDTPIGVQQKFTLLCLANGKAAFQVSNTFVTALNDEAGRDWEMRAGMTARQEWEEFTLVNPDTREQLPCRQVVEQLGQNPVRLAIQTFHQKDGKNRFVTAMGEDRDWVIRAETTELKQWEVFTAAIAPAPCATCTGCLTGRGYGCSANMPAGAVPYCTETFSLASPVTATQIRIEMTKRALANYGYSLYEVQAYGPADAQTNLLAPYLFSLKVDPATLAAGQVSAPLREQFRDPAPVLGPQAQIKAGPVGGQWIITDTDRIYVIRSEKQELNVYGGMQVRASSIEGDGYIAPYAIDGIDNNKASRWSSAHCCVSKNCPADEKGNPVCDNPAGRDPQWLEITLPKPAQISRIVLKWEEAYAVEYCVIVVVMSD